MARRKKTAKKILSKKAKKISIKKKAKAKVKVKVKKRQSAKRRKKAKKVLPVPKGYHSITPYLIINGAAKAIEFYKAAFSAKAAICMDGGGRVAHAELKMGDSKIMLADEFPEMEVHGPRKFAGTPVMIHFYTKNVDTIVSKAVAAGATVIRPPQDMFYGDRTAMVEDPFGHKWCISTHIEDVTPAKLKKRAAEYCTGQASSTEI